MVSFTPARGAKLNMSTRSLTQYVSICDAASALGVTELTIRRYIAAGRLSAYRLGSKTLRLRLEDVEALAHKAGEDAAS
jgi:excisionase family DNA binding protein